MNEKSIIYEQPLNEQIRLCLRLEYLFGQADYYLNYRSHWDLRQALNAILEILNISDRPDIKNKLGQVLNQYASSLTQLEKIPDIDKHKLNAMLNKIDCLIDSLHANAQKIGQELRDNEFLTAIQQRLYTPAGTCNFSLPSYNLWLHQDQSLIRQRLLSWLESFKLLRDIMSLMLSLTRESTTFKPAKAIGGFYQGSLEANIYHQMIRIGINSDKQIFPEISVGRHRLAVHFFSLDINGRAAQTPDDIIFELACCKI